MGIVHTIALIALQNSHSSSRDVITFQISRIKSVEHFATITSLVLKLSMNRFVSFIVRYRVLMTKEIDCNPKFLM